MHPRKTGSPHKGWKKAATATKELRGPMVKTSDFPAPQGDGAAPDTWILPEGMDRDQMAKAVEIVLDWYQYGGLAVDLVAKLYPVLCPRSAVCPHHEKPTGRGGHGR